MLVKPFPRLGWLALALALASCGNGGATPSQPGGAGQGVGGQAAAGGVASGGNSSASAGTAGTATSVGGTAGSHAGGSNGGAPPVSGGATSTGGSGAASTGGGGAAGASGAATGGSASAFPPGVIKPKIMIVGDSISAGPGCYKKFLLQALTDNHYSSFEFVGEYTDDCGSTVRHSAVSCSTAEQYTMPTFTMPNCSQGTTFPGLSTLVASHHPDLIMLQLGVNDVWNGKAVDVILGNYKLLVDQARAHNPRVVLAVARIQKINPDCSTDDSKTKLAEMLVNAVPAWAQGLSTEDSPIFVADLWTNSDPTKAETLDCVHPNDIGAQKMGLN